MAMNIEEIKKMLRAGEKVIVEPPTEIPGILANITIIPNGKGGVVLKGYAVKESPKSKLDNKMTTRRAKTIHGIELLIRDVAVAVGKKYEKAHRPKVVRAKKTKGFIVEGLKSIIEELKNPDNYVKYIHKRWAASTTEGAVQFLICSVAPLMDTIGEYINEDDMLKIKSDLCKRAAGSGHTKKTADGKVKKKSIDTAESGIEDRFRRAGIIYQWALENHPELELPEVEFPKSLRAKKIREEKAKALPDEIRIRFATLIYYLCAMGVNLAYGVALEFFCGLRVSEAAAPLIGELILILNSECKYGKYFVEFQLDKHGNRTPELKKPSSKRYVPLISTMVDIVQMRISQLEAAGFKKDEIMKMPLVSYWKEPTKFVDQDHISAFAKELLQLAGCDDRFMEEASKIMYEHPEYVNGKPVFDLASHLCRRDFATRLKGHYSVLELDAVLGHENSGNNGKDYASNDTIKKLARELEVCFTFDTNLTQNPAYQAVKLHGTENLHLIGNTAYLFENTTDKEIVLDLDILSFEPDVDLRIQMDSGVRLESLQRRTPTDTPAKRKGRNIRNRYFDVEFIKKYQMEAEHTDISGLLNKFDK